ncbi:MAG: release factor glutamine methyltransferase [Pirellulaceae bacterium]|nr:MAG: release factor glutamine methyltransferase [Pirellulaceae bacterium]
MSQESEPWTIGRLLTWTTDYLARHGSGSPRLDAEVLLAQALQCQRIDLYARYDQEPAEQPRSTFRELVKRRAAGTPVAYLVGHREFYSIDFEVTPDVLIPRPETEHLVVEAIDRLKTLAPRRPAPCHVADIGTGSGCIAIALAKYVPQVRVTAVDVSDKALEVARRNVLRHDLQARVELVHSDLFTGLPANRQFDIIVSNPPYVSAAEYEQLDRSVREFEPRLALLADHDGWGVIERLLDTASEYLAPDGFLLVEASPMLLARADHRIGAPWAIEKITDDLAGLPRVLTLRLE